MITINQMTPDDIRAWKPGVASFEVIREIAGKIAEFSQPEKIVFFGSYARGDANEHSDIDILVIMESDEPPHKRSVPIYDLLSDYMLAVEVIVRTPEEAARYKDVPSSFIQTILREGVTLYERKHKFEGAGES